MELGGTLQLDEAGFCGMEEVKIRAFLRKRAWGRGQKWGRTGTARLRGRFTTRRRFRDRFGRSTLRPAMFTTRFLGSMLTCMVVNLNMTTCRSPGEADPRPTPATEGRSAEVQLPGVDTSDLTNRERAQWSALVSELLAPCEDTPVSVRACIETERACGACAPAAQFLLQQTRQGRTKAQAEAVYRLRFAADQVKEIPLDGSPSKGAEDAPIVIVEWADFECPACRSITPALDAFVEKNPDVRLVFKNFPLDFHAHAETAARAVTAAHQQGKFWEMHKELFATSELSQETIRSIAKKLGLDMPRFEKDLRSEAVADAVASEKKQGKDVQLRGTPALFINGREFNYSVDLVSDLGAWVEMERQILGLPTPSAVEQAQP